MRPARWNVRYTADDGLGTPFVRSWSEAGPDGVFEKSEIRSQKVRDQRSEVRGQRSEIRSQKSEVRNQKSEVRSQMSEKIRSNTDVSDQQMPGRTNQNRG